MNKDYPCKCGHLYSDHRNSKYPNLLPYAYNDCRYELGSTRLCLCSDFKQDNLRYLEEKYRELSQKAYDLHKKSYERSRLS
jgi:hypothetical protein